MALLFSIPISAGEIVTNELFKEESLYKLPNQLSFELLSRSLLKQLCDPNDNL